MSGAPGQTDAASFAAAAVERTLGRSTGVDSCVALAREVADLTGQALDYFRQEQPIACQAGCAFCCHLRVMVLPHEAIALHRHLSNMPAAQAQQVRARLRSNAVPSKSSAQNPSQSAPVAARSACAFLLDGECSAYEVRPLACAGYHSLSRAACEADHAHAAAAASHEPSQPAGALGTPGIPVSQAMQQVAVSLGAGLTRGLNLLALPAQLVELQSAVAALLAQPALIGRWRDGREWPRDASGRVRTR